MTEYIAAVNYSRRLSVLIRAGTVLSAFGVTTKKGAMHVVKLAVSVGSKLYLRKKEKSKCKFLTSLNGQLLAI